MICKGTVTSGGKYRVAGARVVVFGSNNEEMQRVRSDENGHFTIADLRTGNYTLRCNHFNFERVIQLPIRSRDREVSLDLDIDVGLTILSEDESGQLRPNPAGPIAGQRSILRIEFAGADRVARYDWRLEPAIPYAKVPDTAGREIEFVAPATAKPLVVKIALTEEAEDPDEAAQLIFCTELRTRPAEIQSVEISEPVRLREPVGVRLHRTPSDPTPDQALWVAIRNRTQAMSFARYREFMDRALCFEERTFNVPREIRDAATRERIERDLRELGANLHGVRAYRTLKLLTEAFLLMECGVRIERLGDFNDGSLDPEDECRRLGEGFSDERMEQRLRDYLGDCQELPYIAHVVEASFPPEYGALEGRLIGSRINQPCLLELWWSYCMEWGGLVQTMNAISLRFQNVRRGSDRDPLANLSIDPLRPLSNLFFSFVRDEPNRLSVQRRAYEYVHQYGLTLRGHATSGMNPADIRSKFLQAFHNLVYQATIFYKEDNNTTIISNGYPALNCLKEIHLLLAQGADNQFGDCAWEARVEMMLMQYLLARRETRDFLQCRVMVPYKEAWEGPVDAMKALQGWQDASGDHYVDLGVHGERILLGCRYGDWTRVNDEDAAKNFLRYFKLDLNAYICAWRAITGIDLTNPDGVNVPIAGVFTQNRWATQRAR